MDTSSWNWVQFALSLPVVFMLLGCFVRAYKSVITELKYVYPNRNWFRVAFYSACLAYFSQNTFQMNSKLKGGTVHLYFEATTVILTLVLLGQLLKPKRTAEPVVP
jgi:Cu2+-exporting ATPase